MAKRLAIEDFGQKPSRAAMAIVDMLLEASRQKGHTYMLWDQLQQSALHHLNSTGLSFLPSQLPGLLILVIITKNEKLFLIENIVYVT